MTPQQAANSLQQALSKARAGACDAADLRNALIECLSFWPETYGLFAAYELIKFDEALSPEVLAAVACAETMLQTHFASTTPPFLIYDLDFIVTTCLITKQ